MYDFDAIIDRSNTDAIKLEMCGSMFGTSDITPMWVADMDFACPQPIVMTIRERMEHPIYGYTMRTPRFQQYIKLWQQRRNAWDIDAHWIEWSPDVVPALSMSVQALTQPGDGIIIQPPVYPPFYDVVVNNGRTLLENHLVERDGKWTVDLDEFEQMASRPSTKAFILCHPHNPVGHEWTEEELKAMGDICVKHGVRILSDEIHSDIMLYGRKHHPMATMSDEIAMNTVTFMAASKTFNIAGLSTSYIIAKNAELLERYRKVQQTLHLESNMLGPLALQAAYQNCEPWLNELQTYVGENIDLVCDIIRRDLPEVKIIKPEATYLMWLDMRALEISHDDLKYMIYNRARLGINDGTTFGKRYEKCFRLNVASPSSVVEEAMNALVKTLAPLRK